MAGRKVGSGSNKNHNYARTKQNLKKRMPDADQVVKHIAINWKPELDEDLPASGAFYCQVCCRHFINETVMQTHARSKPHKRALAKAKQDIAFPYTVKDADFYAGKSFT